MGVPRSKRLQGAGLRLASRCCGLAARLAEAEGRGCMPPRDWPRPPRARLSHCRRSSGWRGGRTEGCRGWRAPGNMAAADLAQIPDVDIDLDGVFKYVLIRVRAAAPSEAPAGESKDIVRGYKWAEYHARRVSFPGVSAVQSWGFGPLAQGQPELSAALSSRSQPTSTTRYLVRCRRRAMTASAWEAGASPTRARTRRSTCTATPWDLVAPSTPSPPRKSRPSTLTTRSRGRMMATEGP